MGLGNSENELNVDDGDGGGGDGGGGGYGKSLGAVSCSICLEGVTDTGDRSWAKLQCGHQFHLDCIGSAFNIKGAMQCPNCRKIEKGQWLYANGCRSVPEINMDDWTHDEDVYYSVSEVSLGVHYCPFSGSMARLPSLFEEGEFPPHPYHDLLGQPAVFGEHISSASHSSCPYVAYFGPVHPSSSSSSSSISDGSNFNSHWSAPSEMMPSSYGFPAVDLHYHNWGEHHSTPFSRIGGVDQPPSLPPNTQRTARHTIGHQRGGGSFMPFVVHPSSGSSVLPSGTPTYQGSNARARDRGQALQDYYQQQQPGSSPARRPSSHRGAIASSSDQSGFYFVPSGREAENAAASRTRFRTEREPSWGVAYHQGSGSETGIVRPSGYRQRHNGSERGSQNRS
ncbi:E3 ubiquitin-protein ligase IPI1 [Linum perenne]